MLDLNNSYYLWQSGINIPDNVNSGVAIYGVEPPFIPNQVKTSRVAPVLKTKLIHIGITNNKTKTYDLLYFLFARIYAIG